MRPRRSRDSPKAGQSDGTDGYTETVKLGMAGDRKHSSDPRRAASVLEEGLAAGETGVLGEAHPANFAGLLSLIMAIEVEIPAAKLRAFMKGEKPKLADDGWSLVDFG